MKPHKTELARYNGKGERVLKNSTSNTGGTRLVFDEAGQLIAQKGSGTSGTEDSYEVVWLDNMPIAVLTNKAGVNGFEYAVLSDHLMSPRALTGGVSSTQAGTTVWRWDLVQGNTSTGNSNAFGAALANQDPDANSVATIFNLRFPGQQFDSATNLNYNYFRDYESATGRYVESDPIGLVAGNSTFTYATARPINWPDMYGLSPTFVGFPPAMEEGARAAVKDAQKGLLECPGCADCGKNNNASDYCVSKLDREKAADFLENATFSFSGAKGACASKLFAGMTIYADAFTGKCCKLAAAMAHEAIHDIYPGEARPYFVEAKCFGCNFWTREGYSK
jgi:RHS repeat-associated protein